jgi:hypothetical protein
VYEQSGIRAGDGGFQIKVAGNTDLKGAVISSTEAAYGLNSLNTATLTQSEIANHAEMEASSIGLCGSATVGGTGGNGGKGAGAGGLDLMNLGKSGLGGGLAGVAVISGSGASTTRSGISAGTIIITDEAAQLAATGKTAAETIAATNRAVATGVDTSGRLDNNFDLQEAPTGGRPGNIVFDPDSSLSAIQHEYGHFLDDAALEFPGQRYYYENPNARVATERRQYLVEIRTAQGLGDTTARRQLIEDFLSEKKYLIDNYYTKPYGTK